MEQSNSSAKDDQQDTSTTGQPTHSPDSVDLTLIRWMLSLTLDERLEVLQQHLNAITSLRDANSNLARRDFP